MEELYRWFKVFAMMDPKGVDVQSLFVAICPDGNGWIADGLDVHHEFRTPGEGVSWIQREISRQQRRMERELASLRERITQSE